METKKKKFSIQVPHVYSLLLLIVLICSVLSYVIPAGTYDMVTLADGREVVDPTSYHRIEQTPVTLIQMFAAMFEGCEQASGIIFLIFVAGGAFGVIFETKAFDAFIVRVALLMEGREKLIIPILMAVFCFMGCTIGSQEELLVYIPIVMSLCLALGFDSLTAAAIILVGAAAGFTGSIMNIYTEGVAQSIAGLPLFSGMGFRAVILVVMFLISVIYVWRYAAKVKKDPSKSLMYDYDKTRELNVTMSIEDNPFSLGQKLTVISFCIAIGLLVVGTLKLGWWYAEICAIFFGLGVFAAIFNKMSLNQFGEAYEKGMIDVCTGAIVVGVARAILVVMEQGNLIHTILFFSANLLDGLPGVVCAEGMYVIQSALSYIIPSGSGQAAVTMPLMAPLSDIVGITRQTCCVIFQIADGISNIFTPTSGYLMATLGMAKIPWIKWAKFVGPLIGFWYIMGGVFVAIAYFMKLGPF